MTKRLVLIETGIDEYYDNDVNFSHAIKYQWDATILNIDNLRKVLDIIEWDWHPAKPDREELYVCPICEQIKPDGHTKLCALKVLKEQIV